MSKIPRLKLYCRGAIFLARIIHEPKWPTSFLTRVAFPLRAVGTMEDKPATHGPVLRSAYSAVVARLRRPGALLRKVDYTDRGNICIWNSGIRIPNAPAPSFDGALDKPFDGWAV